MCLTSQNPKLDYPSPVRRQNSEAQSYADRASHRRQWILADEMYGSDKNTDDSERTAFRRAEKKYKLYYDDTYKSSKKYSFTIALSGSISFYRHWIPCKRRCFEHFFAIALRKKLPKQVDLSEVIDFKSILESYKQDGALPLGVNATKCDLDGPVFCLENRPGIADSPFSTLFQRKKDPQIQLFFMCLTCRVLFYSWSIEFTRAMPMDQGEFNEFPTASQQNQPQCYLWTNSRPVHCSKAKENSSWRWWNLWF